MKNNTTNFLIAAVVGVSIGLLVLKEDKPQPFILPNPEEEEEKKQKEESMRNQFPLKPSAAINPLIASYKKTSLSMGLSLPRTL